MKIATTIFVSIGTIITFIAHMANVAGKTFYYKIELFDKIYKIPLGYNLNPALSLVLAILAVFFGILNLIALWENKKSVFFGITAMFFSSFIGGILYICWDPHRHW
jgi:hypothetical protein